MRMQYARQYARANSKCPHSVEDVAEDKLVNNFGDDCREEKEVADNLLCHRSRKPNSKAMPNAMQVISMKPYVVRVLDHKPA